jgi:glycosyltransferase involved in cell wall biosynthesis
VLAVPSLAEGFGLPLLEAMAAGVPVVHSDAPALVEVAACAGVAVPRGDAGALAVALRGVLGSPARAAELVTLGRARVADFSWHTAAKAVWALHQRRN